MPYPEDVKRTTFMYNETPIQISGPGQYAAHPDYEYLEGRKLEQRIETGFEETWAQRFPAPQDQVAKERAEKKNP